MGKLKTKEEIFDEQAKQHLKQYDSAAFKRNFPHLHDVLMKSMSIYAKQGMSEAIDDCTVEGSCENKSFHRLKMFLERIKAKL